MPRTPNRAGGGSQPNRNGLLFEQSTSLNEALLEAGFEIQNNYDVYYNGTFIGHSINESAFATVFLRSHGIEDREINSKRWEPDEAFINIHTQTVYIIEKKFQKRSGSVDEKLATFPFKIKEYQKLLAPLGYNVEYMYLLSSAWFDAPKYQDYYDYMDELNCPHFFDYLPLNAIGINI